MANAPLNDFISKVKQDGLARNNRFIVGIFANPNSRIMNLGENNWMRDALLLCDQVQIPGTNFNTADMRTFGEIRKTPYERLYDDVNISFYVDTQMTVKLLFDNWMTYIQDPGTRNFNYYDDYVSDIVIEVQDTKNQSRYGIKLFEAYPKSIGAIQLDHSNKDIMKLSVNFAYKYYHIGAQEVENTDAADGGFSPYNFLGDTPSQYTPIYNQSLMASPVPRYQNYSPVFNQIPAATQLKKDPLNSFMNRLKNFAIGAVGAKVVSSLPGILKR